MKTTLRVILVIGFTGCLMWVMGGPILSVQGDSPARAPHECRECHLEAYESWARSAHNTRAFIGREFRAVWARERQSPQCRACHTTGYTAETGSQAYTGVSCEACHQPVENGTIAEGEYREHEQLSIPRRVDECGVCHGAGHALTYVEWEASAHNGGIEVGCLSCHDAHSGHLVETDMVALCGSCHFQPVPVNSPHMGVESGCTDCHPVPIATDNVHMHENSDAAADCVACHMVTEEGPYGLYLSNAGHTLQASLAACVNCHGSLHDLQSGQ